MSFTAKAPDWRQFSDYASLLSVDRCAFAWEWTRRNAAYRRAWIDRSQTSSVAHHFGLERFEDPDLTVPLARPIWIRTVDPSVIIAKVQRFRSTATDSVDLLDFSDILTIFIGDDRNEHLLFSDGFKFLRVDVTDGTLIGCPAVLHYLLEGFDRLRSPMKSVERLLALKETGRLPPSRGKDSTLVRRWIMELRAADALHNGAAQQDIARELFGGSVSSSRWRSINPSIRSRVQRLARAVRTRLAFPTDPRWFTS